MHIDIKQNFPLFHVVLVEPEIPGNTGNIGRTCVGTKSCLHIVGRPSFIIDDKKVRRAGLDYWPHLKLVRHNSFTNFENYVPDISRVFFLSTKSSVSVFDTHLQYGDYFVFGKETKGLDKSILDKYSHQMIGLPMLGPIRSHNLANTVTTVIYEGIRQILCQDKRQKPISKQDVSS